MARRHEVSQAQWERIGKLLPRETGHVGRPCKDNRGMLNAMMWIAKTGAPWRDLPRYYGKWQGVYGRFRRWSRRGVWKEVLQVLAEHPSECALIDATIVRAHQDATGAQKGDRAKVGMLSTSVIREEDRQRSYTLLWTASETRCGLSLPPDKCMT
jgi:transposase